MPNPAALALALLLGHEARITSEQWSEVRAMACTKKVELMYEDDLPVDISKEEYSKWFQQSIVYNGVRMGPWLPGISISRWFEVLEVCDSSLPQVTPCPACEAAARELADAKAETVDVRKRYRAARDQMEGLNALCDRQSDILSRVAVALRGPEPPLTKWGHHDLPERVAAVVRERDKYIEAYAEKEVARYDAEQEANHAQRQLADLRARIAATAQTYSRDMHISADLGDLLEDLLTELRALLAEKETE